MAKPEQVTRHLPRTVAVFRVDRADRGVATEIHHHERQSAPLALEQPNLVNAGEDEPVHERILDPPRILIVPTGDERQSDTSFVTELCYAGQELLLVGEPEELADPITAERNDPDRIDLAQAEHSSFWIGTSVAEIACRSLDAL